MNKKVLVVEDEANIRSFIVVNLRISDFQVVEASSGEEALSICETENLDVAVLDIMLPGMDGYELCERLREKFENIAWGEGFFGDYKTVDVHIRRLREKIEENPSNPKFIQTVWGYGYRFTKL